MWDQYRRTFLPIQLFILSLCTILLYFVRIPLQGVLVPFTVMEIGAIYGARWATRLRGFSSKDSLPLKPR